VRIGVLNNLRAGRNERRIARMLSFLRDCPEISHVETERGDHVREALVTLAQRDIDILAVNGGDGTLQRVLTEITSHRMFSKEPLIVPLRGGRTNMIALDIGSQRNPTSALAILRDVTRSNSSLNGRITERPVLRVDLEPDGVTQYGMSFSVGLLPRAIELTHRMFPEGRAQGVFGSGVVVGGLVLRAAFGKLDGILQPDQMEITLDGRSLAAKEFLVTLVTTLDRFFLRLRPFWGREAAPIRFMAVAAGAARPPLALLKILYGRPPAWITPDVGYPSHNVGHLELRIDCGLVIDGEMFAPRPGRVVRLSAEHRVRFIRT